MAVAEREHSTANAARQTQHGKHGGTKLLPATARGLFTGLRSRERGREGRTKQAGSGRGGRDRSVADGTRRCGRDEAWRSGQGRGGQDDAWRTGRGRGELDRSVADGTRAWRTGRGRGGQDEADWIRAWRQGQKGGGWDRQWRQQQQDSTRAAAASRLPVCGRRRRRPSFALAWPEGAGHTAKDSRGAGAFPSPQIARCMDRRAARQASRARVLPHLPSLAVTGGVADDDRFGFYHEQILQ
jgi:hypothetical protein